MNYCFVACKKRRGKSEGKPVQCSYHTGKTTENKCLAAEAKRQTGLGSITCITFERHAIFKILHPVFCIDYQVYSSESMKERPVLHLKRFAKRICKLFFSTWISQLNDYIKLLLLLLFFFTLQEVGEPSKEEKAVAKYLRFNCPTKSTNMMGHRVDYFIGRITSVKLY